MDVREVKMARLAELKANLMSVEGTPTEVYSRIVGYYRSVRNWNAGKREEFGRRREYAFPGAVPAVPQGLYTGSFTSHTRSAASLSSVAFPETQEVGEEAGNKPEADRIASWLLFTRKSCPNCPPVSAAIKASGFDGETLDVDTVEGLAMAGNYRVLTTPTVILLDAKGRELGRAFTKPQLTALLAPVREKVLA